MNEKLITGRNFLSISNLQGVSYLARQRYSTDKDDKHEINASEINVRVLSTKSSSEQNSIVLNERTVNGLFADDQKGLKDWGSLSEVIQ